MIKGRRFITRDGYEGKFGGLGGVYLGEGFDEPVYLSHTAADAATEVLMRRAGFWLASNGYVVVWVPFRDNENGRCVLVVSPGAYDGYGEVWEKYEFEKAGFSNEQINAAREWFVAHPKGEENE